MPPLVVPITRVDTTLLMPTLAHELAPLAPWADLYCGLWVRQHPHQNEKTVIMSKCSPYSHIIIKICTLIGKCTSLEFALTPPLPHATVGTGSSRGRRSRPPNHCLGRWRPSHATGWEASPPEGDSHAIATRVQGVARRALEHRLLLARRWCHSCTAQPL